MTPMIDVVFLLLVFFVCTATFRMVDSVLPSPLDSRGVVTIESPPLPLPEVWDQVVVEVAIDTNQLRLTVNGQVCPSLQHLSPLLDSLAAVDDSLIVVLDIAGEVPLGAAIDVYDRALLAGFKKIHFAARKFS